MSTDPFGLDCEKRLAASKVREIFTPTRPVDQIELLFGRENQVKRLIQQINTPGQHSLLFGERAVGKSSLASVATRFLISSIKKGSHYTFRCDSESTFIDVVRKPLQGVGVDVDELEISFREVNKKNLVISPPKTGIGGQVGNESEASRTSQGHSKRVTPSYVAEQLRHHDGLLVVDEADVLKSDNDKKRLAELIKHLSDDNSPFKLLIVGVAETGNELIGHHESIGRCLKETRVPRMSEAELAPILLTGAKRLSLEFERDVIRTIVKLSNGFPYFTQLLALKCAEDAICNSHRRIMGSRFMKSMHSAASDAERSLSNSYDQAVRSSNARDTYVRVLKAAANIQQPEFSKQQLVASYKEVNGQLISDQTLANYLQQLASKGSSTILQRVNRGIYRFNDPRMPSYIKIANSMV